MFNGAFHIIFLLLMRSAARHDRSSGTIPNGISYGGIFLAIFLAIFCKSFSPFGVDFSGNYTSERLSSLISAVLIVSGAMLWTAMLFESLTGRDGLGMGDIRLTGLMGAFLGVNGALHAIAYGVWIAFPLEFFRRKFLRRKNFHRIPLAPYLFYGTIANYGIIVLFR
jgi:leader peptidase (prepilin peptidase)/N-methyltransferase